MNPSPVSPASCEQERPVSRAGIILPVAALLLALALGQVPRESFLSPLLGGALLWFWIASAARVGSRIASRSGPEGSAAAQLLRAALYGYAFVVLSVALVGAAHRLDHVSLTLLSAIAYSVAGPARALEACRVSIRRVIRGVREHPFTALVVAAAVGVFAINVGWAGLCPPLHNDDLSYHIAFPVEWGQTGTLSWKYIPFGNNSPPYYPKNTELYLTWLYLPLRGIAHLTISQALVFPVAGLAVFVLMRDLGGDVRSGLLGASLCLLTGPIIRYFPSAYVDLIFAVLFVLVVRGLVVLSKQPSPARWIDLCLAAGLLLGTKVLAVAMISLVVPPLACVLLWPRRKDLFRLGAAKVLGWAAFGALLVLACGGWWYASNWISTGNPLFPLIVEVFGFELFDGAYDRSSIPKSDPIRALAVFVPSWSLSDAWHRVAPLLPFAAGLLGTLVVAAKSKQGRLLLLVGLGAPALIAVVFAAIVPFGYSRFIFAIVFFSAVLLIAPLQGGKWASRTMGVLIAVSLISTALYPVQHSVLLLPLGHPAVERTALVGFGLASGIGFALGAVALAVSVLSRKSRLVLTAGVGVLGALFLSVLWKTSDPSGPHVIEGMQTLWAPYAFVEERYPPSRIAFAGGTDSLRHYGWHQRNHVRYLHLDEPGDATFHDRVRSLAERREELRGDLLGYGYYRSRPSYEAWLANLEAYGAELLVCRKLPVWVLRKGLFFESEDGFSREDHWAEAHPERFERVYDDGSVRVYEISGEEPGR